MNTLADLKRKLKVGTSIKLIYSRMENSKRLNLLRYVIKTQTNGVYLNEDKNATKGSFLELPRASLINYNEKEGILEVFCPITRELNEEEQEVWDKQPQDEEQSKIDLMTDTNTMFYRRKQYFKNCGFGYLFYEADNSKKITFYNGKPLVIDKTEKGDLDLKYKIE